MKIGIFAYNFKHKKTQEGLIKLFLNGYEPECILASDPVKLNFKTSEIRVTPKDLEYEHPFSISNKLGIPYHIINHSGTECSELIKQYDLDLGIILGARIIKQHVIDSFNIGVLNMHPGLLPENRGLDNLKWAVVDELKQGVTSHLIDRYVDRGFLIDRKTIKVYEDDTLLDIFLRLQSLELDMMVEAMQKINKGDYSNKRLSVGSKNDAVPVEIEERFFDMFESYKKNYKYMGK